MSVYIIAEAGVNHNGSLELALRMVDEAQKAGADCIKFQTFKSENLVAPSAAMASYQKKNTQKETSQLEMLRSLELSYDDFECLQAYCRKKGITFLSTPFDMESVAFLDKLDVPFWKIPSGEITNLPYLRAIAGTGRPVVMSTGMCTMEDIESALAVLRQNGVEEIALLHCNTEYPTPYTDVNLLAMDTLKKCFGVPVGYSDHSLGITVPVAAAARGAIIIEKHFTLDKNMAGPDHKASVDPDELAAMVQAIRTVERCLGCADKKPTESEKKNMAIARKSIVAAKPIRKGEVFTEENLNVKRPGMGISPMRWDEVIGRVAVRDFAADELIEL